MATRLDAALSSNAATLAYSVSAASNRRLIVGIAGEGTQTGAHTCDYGGQTGVLIGSEIAGSGTTQQTVSLFAFTDAQIAAASGTTITAGNVPADYNISARSYQDCEQGTLTNFDTDTSAAATPNPLAALDITTVGNDSLVVAMSGMGNAGSAAWASPLTEATDQPTASANGSMADDEVPTATTIACECTWTTQNRAAAVAVEIEHLASAGITAVTPTEFDFDNTDVDIIGSNFEAVQGTGQVWISDASTLAGSVNEVEIDGAINTWADALVNLDFSGLSQTEIDNLHTLGPGATRWIILENDTGDEYSFQITLHRPQAIEMVLSANFAPGSTTARLTGLTGTFGGGRIEETAAQNPSTTNTDVASNGNREDVWNIQAKPNSREVTYDFRVLVGGIVADTITQTPQLTISGGHTASGAVSIPAITADGAANLVRKASGDVSIPAVVAAGSATVRRKASGAVSIPSVTADGAAEIQPPNIASGDVAITPVTADGNAVLRRKSSGAATTPAVTADGAASVRKSASGDVSIPAVESAGTAIVRRKASGDVAIPPVTADGSATRVIQASGDVTIPAIESSGSATIRKQASGAISIPAITADGAASVTEVTNAQGAPIVPAVQASGQATVTHKASGAVVLPSITADGTANGEQASASGDPAITPITADGAASVTKKASGDVSVPSITASGNAVVRRKASGAITTPGLTASGNAEVRHQASGAVSIPSITASGQANGEQTTAQGAPILPAITADGAGRLTRKSSGDVSIGAVTASGQAVVRKQASGAVSIPAITADGAAEIPPPPDAQGAPILTPITASGTAIVRRKASGSPAIPAIEADGTATVTGFHTANSAGDNDRVLLIEDDFERPDGPINPVHGPTFADDFQRADGPLGTNWFDVQTNDPYYTPGEIIANAFTVTYTPSVQGSASLVDQQFRQNQFAECTVGQWTLTEYNNAIQLFVRASVGGGENHWYGVYVSTSEVDNGLDFWLYRNNNNSSVVIKDTWLPGDRLHTGDRIRLEAKGDRLRVYFRGNLIAEEIDTNLPNGQYVGLGVDEYIPGADASIADFHGGEQASLVVTDDFDRAALGPNWDTPGFTAPTARTCMEIVTQGTLQPCFHPTGDWTDALYTADRFTDDQYAEAVLRFMDGGNWDRLFGVYVRADGSVRQAYNFLIMHDTVGDFRWWSLEAPQPAGAAHFIGSGYLGSGEWPAGTTIRLEAVGTTLRGYIDGTLIVTAEDGQYASGQPGVNSFTYNGPPELVLVESFSAGDLVTPKWEPIYLNFPSWYTMPGIEDGRAVLGPYVPEFDYYHSTTTLWNEPLPADQWAEIEFSPYQLPPPGYYNYVDAWVQIRSTSGHAPTGDDGGPPYYDDAGDLSYDSGIYVIVFYDITFPNDFYLTLSRWDNFSEYPSIADFHDPAFPDLTGKPFKIGIEAQGETIRGYYDLMEGAGRQYVLSVTEPMHRYQNKVGFGDETGTWRIDEPFDHYPGRKFAAEIEHFRAGGFGHNTPHIAMKGRAIVRKHTSGAVTIGSILSDGNAIADPAIIRSTIELDSRQILIRLDSIDLSNIELESRDLDIDLESETKK